MRHELIERGAPAVEEAHVGVSIAPLGFAAGRKPSVCYAAGLDNLEVDMPTLLVHVTSSQARAVRPGDRAGLPVEMAPPSVLVRLTFECDRVLSY